MNYFKKRNFQKNRIWSPTFHFYSKYLLDHVSVIVAARSEDTKIVKIMDSIFKEQSFLLGREHATQIDGDQYRIKNQ